MAVDVQQKRNPPGGDPLLLDKAANAPQQSLLQTHHLIGEAFNLYNAANLSGYSGDLTNPAFGQPTSRFTQVFGSGGPRAFQLAARVSF